MSRMKDLFGDTLYTPPSPDEAFDGETYQANRDYLRLNGQLGNVFETMRDGRWRTINNIAAQVIGSPQAISARLRDLRKAKYGAHEVERKSLGRGLFAYRLIVRENP